MPPFFKFRKGFQDEHFQCCKHICIVNSLLEHSRRRKNGNVTFHWQSDNKAIYYYYSIIAMISLIRLLHNIPQCKLLEIPNVTSVSVWEFQLNIALWEYCGHVLLCTIEDSISDQLEYLINQYCMLTMIRSYNSDFFQKQRANT